VVPLPEVVLVRLAPPGDVLRQGLPADLEGEVLVLRAEEEIERLEASGSRLSQGDIFAVTMGKCLEVFSQHYPNVTHDGDTMSVINALDTIRDIVDCYNPDNRHEREETERFRSYSYEELMERDKVNLDIFWLKDDSLEDVEDLPEPEVLAADITENLEAALDQFSQIQNDLTQ